MHLTRRILLTALSLYLGSQLLFLLFIQFPKAVNFDEFHYVPSAKQFLDLKENQNWEHPPLGKELMAVGIGLWGDRPIGWRYMSTIFGSLTLVGMYFWALFVFKNERHALWTALLTVVNNLLYVQARIGMLDTFMFAFIVWAIACFTATWTPDLSFEKQRKYLAGSGICFGFATACKWFGLMPWLGTLGIILVVRLLQHWNTTMGDESTDWYHPHLWKNVKWRHWAKYLVLYPFLAYAVTFLPFFFIESYHMSPWEFIQMQRKMYDGQLRVVTSHPYMSQWLTWPLMIRPIWYAFEKTGNLGQFVRGVLLLGNPLVMYSGLLAVAVCFWSWVRGKSREGFIIFFYYAVFFFSWSIIPRKVAFYYYYYPAGMTLSLAIAYVFKMAEAEPLAKPHGKKDHSSAATPLALQWPSWTYLALSLVLFVYFFPILSGLKIESESFRKWMWLSSWI